MNKKGFAKFSKRGFAFSFAWIFAILVGGMILFLAIFATTRLVDTERNVQDSESGKQLGILLTPLETSLESGTSTIIKFSEESRLINTCKNIGIFGIQEIGVASKSSLGGEAFRESGIVASQFNNKYIFSQRTEQGEKMTLFVKPFEFPFKVADLSYVFAEEYCFVNPPNEIKDEIEGLGVKGLNVSTSKNNCKAGSKIVCFGSSGCDVDVSLSSQSVKKGRESVFYDDRFGNALLYGAIFADGDIYECQVKRLMRRAGELALLESEKMEYLASEGCGTEIVSELSVFANSARSLQGSSSLNALGLIAQQVEGKNDNLICKVY